MSQMYNLQKEIDIRDCVRA